MVKETMSRKTENTRNLLLITAGELFGSLGYDSVSTRMIAEKAGVKLSSIHYHFGSKENLYLEAFSWAKHHGARSTLQDVMNENPSLADTKEGQAEIIRTAVFRRFHEYFNPERPLWEIQILLREVVSPSSALPVLTEKLFKPEVEATESFFWLVKPKGSVHEAYAWGDMFHSLLFFYTMTKEPRELIRGKDDMSREFVLAAARNLSRAMILVLDLPLPKDLQ